jgi:hypothetical protein
MKYVEGNLHTTALPPIPIIPLTGRNSSCPIDGV